MGNRIKIALKVYSVILLILRLIVAGIVILAVFSFAVQQVSLENIGTPFVEVNGTRVIINIPVTIKNYGFYSIDNISVRYYIKNETVELVNGSQEIGNINVNNIDTFDIPIVIDLEKIYQIEYPRLYHFTHKDMLNVNVTLSLKYMLNWINISLNINHKFQWIPPLEKVIVYNVNSVKMNSSGNLFFNVPYLLKTGSYLSGVADIKGRIFSSEKAIGKFFSQAQLGISYRGDISTWIFSKSVKSLLVRSQNLSMVGNISLFGFNLPFREKYHWGAPLANLSYSIISNQVLHYSFTDEASFPLSLKITKIYYYEGSEVKSEVSYLNVLPGEHVEKNENLNISQPIDEIKVIFYDKNTGITYEEVLRL